MKAPTDSNDSILYILDSYALIYRSYFAFVSRPLINKDGKNISAVFGFFRTLNLLLSNYKPAYFVAAFDSRIKTFRHEMYPEYKATRQKTPEDLHAQVPVIEEILRSLGIPVIRQDGYEADDVIATLSERCCQEGRSCRIISSDKDLMQLIRCCDESCAATVEMMRTNKNGGWDILGPKDVVSEWGVPPQAMLDILALTGDAADNIPGVKGIGEKTAVKLLTEYGSLDALYQNIGSISGSTGKKLAEGKESAYFSRELIKLRYDADIQVKLEDFSIAVLDKVAAARLLVREGAVSVARQYCNLDKLGLIPASGATAQNAAPQSLIPQDIAVQKDEIPATPIAKNGSAVLPGRTTGFPAAVLLESEDVPFSMYKENPGVYTAVTDSAVLASIIDICIEKKRCAFDCETTSVDAVTAIPVGFSLSYESGSAYYIPLVLSSLVDSGTVCIAKETAFRELSRLFCAPGMTVIMHNAKYDYTVMSRCGVTIDRQNLSIFDTMIAAWLLAPERKSFSLESLAGARLGYKTISYSSIVEKNATFDQTELAIAVRYAAEDADLTFQLAAMLEPLLEASGLRDLFCNLEMPLIPILSQMEQTGIKILPDELAAYGVALQEELRSIEQQIYNMAGHSFNIASPKQLQSVLFDELKLPAGKKTKTGYSTDGSVLEELASSHPVPAAIVRYRQLAKLKSTYVDTLPRMADSNGRIHTSFIQTGTATGRLSSRDPNLQNIPIRDEEGRRIRTAFCAPDGWQLVSADYAQIELVVLAHLSNDTNMQQAFLSGEDVHRKTAALIFNTDPSNVTTEMRRVAKTINFGVMYGMSAFRLSNELKISRSEAQDFITAYFSTYRGIRTFMDGVIEDAVEKGYVETIMGRRRYIPDITSKNKMIRSGAERIAVNTPIQGSAADIVKRAMINVVCALEKARSNAHLLLQVHDELIFEVPEEEVTKVVPLIQEQMESVLKLAIPLRVNIETGARWGSFH